MRGDGKILVVGCDGMLGQAFMRSRPALVGVNHAQMDVTSRNSIASLLEKIRPETVVNCSGYTDVDRAEAEPDRAFRINHIGVGLLAEACEKNGARLVHFSTDYVFNSERRIPYKEDEAPSPRGAYARSKYLGEAAAQSVHGRLLLVRTSWLFGHGGKNFVETILSLAESRPVLRVVNDQYGRPTLTDDLVAAVWKLLESNASGIFHVCNSGETNWRDFAREILRLAKISKVNVEAQTTAELGRPAPRPAYSVLDCSKFEKAFGALPPWTDALARYLCGRKQSTPAR